MNSLSADITIKETYETNNPSQVGKDQINDIKVTGYICVKNKLWM